MGPDIRRSWLFLALTLVAVGYFMVWLPHDSAGLSYIGLEMGEQVKFLPQVRSGEVVAGPSLFYLPPITLAISLILISSQWSGLRWQTWAARIVGVAFGLLALPAFEAFAAGREEWLWRLLLIAVVIVSALLSPLLSRGPEQLSWLLLVVVTVFGAILPTWAYLEVRPAFAIFYQAPIGIGVGVWLNMSGHLLVASMAILEWRKAIRG